MSNIKKHLKMVRLSSPLLPAAIRIWRQRQQLFAPLSKTAPISLNLASRFLIQRQKGLSFREQISGR